MPGIFRETKIEEGKRCYWVDLIEREEMETRNEEANRCDETRNEEANRCDWVDLFIRIETPIFCPLSKWDNPITIEDLETRNEGANRCHWVDLIKREEMQRKINERMMQRDAILNADTREEKMTVDEQEVYLSNRRFCHGTKLLKSSLSLAPFFLPSAGGTGHGSGQPEHQSHSEIYPSTLNVVSNCPSRGEYMQTSLTKCTEVCGSYMQDGDCAYHCMRDSSKTKLVEFCAKPKPFFDYCPEYDPVDQTIQKDMATLCNSTSSRNYYNSSDIYFCDPNNCLQLHESSVRNGATTLTTLMNETTEINDGDSQEWILPLFIVLAALIAVIIIGYILFRVFVKRGIFSAYIRKMRKKRNQNEKQNVYREETITFGGCEFATVL